MIRIASASDAAELARLHAMSFPEPWDELAIAGLLTSLGTLALLAEEGFILVRAVAGEAEILTLTVSPSARRNGLGRALIEAAVQGLAEQADTLFLEVAEDNVAARALYAAGGFEPVGRRMSYYHRPEGTDVDALVLRRTLTPPAP